MKQRLFLLVMCFSFVAILTNSCQNDDGKELNISKEIISNLGRESKQMMAKEFVVRQTKKNARRVTNPNAQLTKTIYVDFPENTPSYEIEKVSELKSLNDMMLLAHQTAAEFHIEKSDLTRDSISVSENEVKEALSPMIIESRNYLYSKGFTKQDIDDMLKENNADEAVLISFVLTLVEREQLENKLAIIKNNSSSFFFATPAKAAEVDWGKAGNCALHALGFDIFCGLSQSTLKTWGVTAMKRAFATVAKKIVGPIGVVIFVGDFTWCYFN